MKNKLISDEKRKQYKEINGDVYPEDRCSGKSTGKALETIGKSMRNPRCHILIRDHQGTIESDRFLRKLILSILITLKLKHFDVIRTYSDYYLVYNVFE